MINFKMHWCDLLGADPVEQLEFFSEKTIQMDAYTGQKTKYEKGILRLS